MLRNNVKTAEISNLKISNKNEARLSVPVRPTFNLIHQKKEQSRMPFYVVDSALSEQHLRPESN